MRPPANIVIEWLKEKFTFPVRGLVLLRSAQGGWRCHIEILRLKLSEIDDAPIEKAAYEIALSAVFRYLTSTTYDGPCEKVITARGKEVRVPSIAFELAKFLVDRLRKMIEDGGGAIPINQLKDTARKLKRSLKNAEPSV